jgi:putative spermidine/putrescine transport system substrate-binding protein
MDQPKPSLRRRRPLLTAMAGALAAPFVIPARAAETLVVTAYGGEYQEIFMRTVIEPFQKKFGVEVQYSQSGGSAETYAKIRAARGTPGFDVAAELGTPEAVLGAREKFLEPVTEKDVPNLRYAWPRSLTAIPPVGVITYYQYMTLLWNTKNLEKPRSWAAYWMPETLNKPTVKGHLLGHDPGSNMLEVYALIMAAKLKGGGLNDMTGAWDLLQSQKPWIGAVLQSSAQAAPYFENDQVWLTPYWSGRAGYYASKGYPLGFTIPDEGTIGIAGVSAVPVGATNKRMAFEFINFRLDPEIQRAFCLGYFSSPARPDLTDWPAAFADSQITTQAKMDRLELPDAVVLGRQRNAWVLKWKEIMAG